MTVSDDAQLPIIISGTGPAALLLAHALLKATPPLPFHLYERDLSMTSRGQGYRFRVTGRGIQSCRDVLSPEHFELLRNTCANTKAGVFKRLEPFTGTPVPLPENVKLPVRQMDEEQLTTDRMVMRHVLFRGLEAYTTFGKEIVGYKDTWTNHDEENNNANSSTHKSSILVHFSDGSTIRGALLVGADGIFSRVSAQLAPHVPLLDTEMRMVFGKTPLTAAFWTTVGASDDDDPATAELFKGVRFIADPLPRKSPLFFMYEGMRFSQRSSAATIDPLLATYIPDDYMYWAFALRSDEPEVQGIDWRSMDPGIAVDLSNGLTESWAPFLRALTLHQDRAQTLPIRSAVMTVPRIVQPSVSAAAININGTSLSHNDGDTDKYTNSHNRITTLQPPSNALHPQDASTHRPMVTLIGDAAHAMPPTGGIGVSTALTDSAVLGAALARYGVSRRALEVYEAEMQGYATLAIQTSLQNGSRLVNMRRLEDLRPMER